ncbi:MAG: prepilin-type N-terminal cleavage/methylation domain-containing protein [Azonexus sp.]|nr:prepilin-type N-terminal cleavage/methylation domain-containing protein [Azonexus sp.]
MRHPRDCRGFTLIELMIALMIALVAMLAATELYVGTKQTYRIQGMQMRLSEDGRFALSMLQRMISQAGFRPNPSALIAADFITPTSSQSVTLKFTADGANTIACDGSLPALDSVQTITIAKTGSKLQCGAVDWIAPAAAGAGQGTELVDFRLDYGSDTGPATPKDFGCGADVGANKERDCVADSYLQATATANPTKIVAVKVCLVLRSEAIDGGIAKAAAVKDCSAIDIAGSDSDNKLYRTFRSTVLLRNR